MTQTSDQKTLLAIIGAGGFGREVMPVAAATMGAGVELVFVETDPPVASVNGYPLISEEEFVSRPHDEKMFNIAIANSQARARFAEKYTGLGYTPATLSAKSVTTYDEIDIGEGAILCANATITSNARIGKFFHANLNSYVAHDCVLGDFVTFAPNVACNGNVVIEDHAYIGAGAILRQGSKGAPLRIGAGAVVGMGAVVTKEVPPGTTVVGNPARPLEKR